MAERRILSHGAVLSAVLSALVPMIFLVVVEIWLRFFHQPSATDAWDDIEALQEQISLGLRLSDARRLFYLVTWVGVLAWCIAAVPEWCRSGVQRVLSAAAVGFVTAAALLQLATDGGDQHLLRQFFAGFGALAILVGAGFALNDVVADRPAEGQ